jgi:hypothetical protein
LTTQEIEQLMGRESSAKAGKSWAIDLIEDSTIALNEQLQAAKGYLRDKIEILEGLTDCEVNLSIGWTPRSPQDGVIFDGEMIALLARIRCYILLDTYSD